MAIRILIADDHAVMREGLATLLGLQKDFQIVGEASNGRRAVELAAELKPDVILMDLMMPIMNGVEATRAIREQKENGLEAKDRRSENEVQSSEFKVQSSEPPNTKPRILLLTSFPDSAEIIDAIDAGASGAIAKTMAKEELFQAIRDTAEGKQVIAEEIRPTLSEEITPSQFSQRQLDILEQLARGLTYDDIAQSQNLTKSGVKFHILNLFRKLNVANRSEAISLALRKHLLKN